MRAAAIECTVVQLRVLGARVPAGVLLKQEHPRGFLVCLNRYTAPWWYACLFEAEDMRKEIGRLMHARLERENDGVRLYGGVEFNDQGLVEHRQAWLCVPTAERAGEILRRMSEQEEHAAFGAQAEPPARADAALGERRAQQLRLDT